MDGVPIYSPLSNCLQHESENDPNLRRLDTTTKDKSKDELVIEQIRNSEPFKKEFKEESTKTPNTKYERQKSQNLATNVNSAESLKTEDIKITKLNIVPISSTIISANMTLNTDDMNSVCIKSPDMVDNELTTSLNEISKIKVEKNENHLEQNNDQFNSNKYINAPNLYEVSTNKEMPPLLKTPKFIDSDNYLIDSFENPTLKSSFCMENNKSMKNYRLPEIADIKTNGSQVLLSKREIPISLSSGLSPNACMENNFTYSYSKTNQSYIHPLSQSNKRDVSISGSNSLNKNNYWKPEVKPLSEFMKFKFEEKVITFSDSEMKLIKRIDYILACKFCYSGLNIIMIILILIGSLLVVMLPILYGNNKLPKEIEIIHVMFFNLVVMFIMFVINSCASREVRIDGHYAVRSYIRIYWHLFRKKIDQSFNKKYLFLDDWYGDDKYKFIESKLRDKSKIDEINKKFNNDNCNNICNDEGLEIV